MLDRLVLVLPSNMPGHTDAIELQTRDHHVRVSLFDHMIMHCVLHMYRIHCCNDGLATDPFKGESLEAMALPRFTSKPRCT